MQSLVVASAVAVAVAKSDNFATWARAQGKVYATRDETLLRRSIYAANVAKIEAHNERFAAGEVTWNMATNQFSDLLGEEFKARYTGGLNMRNARTKNVKIVPANAAPPPNAVDWRAAGKVSDVKDQGQCGSCWAFSTTGSVESAMSILTGNTPLPLSEQQLVDCSGPEGNQGCNGGLMDDAFQYIIDNKGITTEAAYPYKAVDGTCVTSSVPAAAWISGFTDVAAGSETALMTAIVQQPISVAVEADQSSFQSYHSGVMTAACGTNLDHGVLAAGYDTDTTGGDYYLVKNSWGAAWGEAGYIRLGRGAAFGNDGQCGIQMMSSFPTAKKTA
jgi:C1A family cysteine protease